MNTVLIQQTALRTLAGTISFPEVVEHLLQAGVEYYHVDYVSLQKTFYPAEGSVAVTLPIHFEGLPPVAASFDISGCAPRSSTVNEMGKRIARSPIGRCGLACRATRPFSADDASPILAGRATSTRNGFPAHSRQRRLAIEH